MFILNIISGDTEGHSTA